MGHTVPPVRVCTSFRLSFGFRWSKFQGLGQENLKCLPISQKDCGLPWHQNFNKSLIPTSLICYFNLSNYNLKVEI